MNGYHSFISNAHPAAIEQMYLQYKSSPASIDPELVKFFQGFDLAADMPSASGKSSSATDSNDLKVYRLIEHYRNYAHLLSDTNPIKKRKDRGISLDYKQFGLTELDLSSPSSMAKMIGKDRATIAEIIAHLEKSYNHKIGFEISHIRVPEERLWLLEKIEKDYHNLNFSLERATNILRSLNKGVVFEEFLGKKFIGEKRFSLEGGENTIPGLEAIIDKSAEMGVKEVVIGMAHRGRLNVLSNIMNKTYEEIFTEFEGVKADEVAGDSDVKYHKGYRSIRKTSAGDVYLNLLPNPSHLEAINPVVLGFSRAKSDIDFNEDYSKVLPIIIHGDAAVAGQGIGLEVAQMSLLKGYRTHGSVHFVINNQIGFTTDFDDARSSDYSTAIANLVGAPIIHVNGDSAEDVVFAAEMAAEYRMKFGKDIYVDMVCYRKHGHNESDDPKYTQPEMYSLISKKKNPRDIYAEYLAAKGTLASDTVKKLDKELYDELQDRLNKVKEEIAEYVYRPSEKAWKKMIKARSQDFIKSPQTAINQAQFDAIVQAMFSLPEGFSPLKKIEKQMAEWKAKMTEQKTLDWQAGELLAYGSILLEGKDVRFSGEDVKRGTFSHRHVCIFDQNNGKEHCRLSNISENQGKMRIYNSPLSEYGVLGYEYGYSVAFPDNLVIWEAQFGDFNNGAQIIIDQFVMSSETKWRQSSGLVMLLPHGYEGQGPEHSSARLERFLQQCAEFNVQVVNITTPANFFHAIRRQLARNFRIPLIVMSPKSLLRHPKCISPVEDILTGGFQELIDDHTADAAKIKRVLYCSGKIYFELLAKKEAEKRNDIAIVRLEQLYPIPIEQLEATFEKYKGAEKVWIQEEPANMGAWTYLLDRQYRMKGEAFFKLISRKTSSSPATGNKKQHQDEVASILERAFA